MLCKSVILLIVCEAVINTNSQFGQPFRNVFSQLFGGNSFLTPQEHIRSAFAYPSQKPPYKQEPYTNEYQGFNQNGMTSIKPAQTSIYSTEATGQAKRSEMPVTSAPYINQPSSYNSSIKMPIIIQAKPSSAKREEFCYTPDGGQGNCISLMSCPALSILLTRDVDQRTRTYVNSFHCGWEGRMPKVCCSAENRFGNDRTTTEPPRSSNLLPGPDVCGVHESDRIVGGDVADIDEHPWIALLNYMKPRGNGLHCGGALISKKYVVTAAHCIKGAGLPATWHLTSVRLGEWNISSTHDCSEGICSQPVQDIPISEIIVHEGYSPEREQDDIALIRLDREVEYNDFVKPICLPVDSKLRRKNFEGVRATVAGWGKTETASHSETKLKVQVPVVSNSRCGSVYQAKNRKIRPKQICAGGEKGRDSCRGDSGGPLMAQTNNGLNWVLIGVVSYGTSPCGTSGWPGVYTRITSYVDWIESNMRP